MTESDLQARLRALPSVDRVIDALAGRAPRPVVAAVARGVIDACREEIRAGAGPFDHDEVVKRAGELLRARERSQLRPVVNATGVLIHTNLGRAPLGKRQLEAIERVASGYSNLEYDLAAGRRGSRYSHAQDLLTALTGAEAALVVNNNAAAVMLVLAALCRDKEVVISRGELIEIGGEFRIPDVMQTSGARLVEVGTTNRTHVADYERAISENTGALMKVHPSNYRVIGFTTSVEARDLARLANGRRVYFLHDLGSGFVAAPQGTEWARREPTVTDALEEGADIVTFSGDKLFGGPQAGIIVGRARLIARIAKHPLLRAVRVDKMTLAALEATIEAYLEERIEEVPLWKLAAAGGDELRVRAEALARTLDERVSGLKAESVPSAAVSGGGSLPGEEVASWAVALTHTERSTAELEAALRAAPTPVLGRIEDDRLLLDLRAVPAELDAELASLVTAALAT